MPPRRSARGGGGGGEKSASPQPPPVVALRRGRSKSASVEPPEEEEKKKNAPPNSSSAAKKMIKSADEKKTTTSSPSAKAKSTNKNKKKVAAGGAQKQPKTKATMDTTVVDETNRLKRETAFLCPMQFRNNLPPPRALDWKLLRRKGSLVDDDMMAEHNVALLYDELRRSTRMFSEDLGINLDPIGSDAFRAARTKGEIHPDDLILLANDSAKDKDCLLYTSPSPRDP